MQLHVLARAAGCSGEANPKVSLNLGRFFFTPFRTYFRYGAASVTSLSLTAMKYMRRRAEASRHIIAVAAWSCACSASSSRCMFPRRSSEGQHYSASLLLDFFMKMLPEIRSFASRVRCGFLMNSRITILCSSFDFFAMHLLTRYLRANHPSLVL